MKGPTFRVDFGVPEISMHTSSQLSTSPRPLPPFLQSEATTKPNLTAETPSGNVRKLSSVHPGSSNFFCYAKARSSFDPNTPYIHVFWPHQAYRSSTRKYPVIIATLYPSLQPL